MPETGALGTIGPERPFFIGGDGVAIRQGGRWYVQTGTYQTAPLWINRQPMMLLDADDEPPQIRELQWVRDVAAFAPVTDPDEAAELDRRLALRLRLGAVPPGWQG